jgi:penicillin amidase
MKRIFMISLIITGLLTVVLISYASSSPENQVVIKRDHYGVPHVYAQTTYGIFYGYGYSIAQDRLFQIEMARRGGQGLTAEVLGENYIDFDKKIRANYNPASIIKQLKDLSEEDRAVFDGYAAGINAWIKEIKNNPDKLKPKQFIDFGFEPQDWSSFDVAMVFVGSMVNRFGDYNTELANEAIFNILTKQLGKSKAQAVFDQLIPLTVEGAPTTIPAKHWPHNKTAVVPTPKQTFKPMLALRDINIIQDSNQTHQAFSNCTLIGKKKAKGALSILMNGPQFGWYNPSYVYSIGLHGAGFNLVGNTPFGYPVILFGHNDRIAWGSTWGAGDMIDVYREKLSPDNPMEYLFKDSWLPMDKRIETIKVKGGPDVHFIVHRTIHGPVMKLDIKNGVAYAKKRTWEGYELDTLLGWMNTTKEAGFQGWLKQAGRSALNINMYYADLEGNIGYAFTGKYPNRPTGLDNRLPASGSGDQEWEGLAPFSTNPKVFNPEQGFIANWNNKPANGVLNPDMFWYSWSKADRIQCFFDELKSRDQWSADDVWSLIKTTSFIDVNAQYFIPLISKAAGKSSDETIKDVAEMLVDWDLQSQDRDGDGQYDEAETAIFQTFLSLMLQYTLQDDLGDAFKFFASPGYPTPEKPAGSGLNIQIGTKAVAEAILDPDSQAYDFFNGRPPEEIALKALTDAVNGLEQKFSTDISEWRLPVAPVVFGSNNFLNIPQADKSESMKLAVGMNRGTENNMIIFSKDGIVAYEVTPPGQSGFVAPDGTKSPHYDDQLTMYGDFEKKRIWLSEKDVEEHKSSEVVLNY